MGRLRRHGGAAFWQRLAASGSFPDETHPPTADRIRALADDAHDIEAQRAVGRRPMPD
ncbi:hypothetical protein [Sphingomonas sp.]|uniref:hypothetical protein n=1 Tax=Sphingomonas sp. TaxID=28214 RepID=UPI003AFF6742